MILNIQKKSIDKYGLVTSLKKVGIKKNDVLFIHSDISKIKNSNLNLKDHLNLIFNSLSQSVGSNGTLVFPAYFHELNKKKPYFDLKLDSSSNSLGILSKYVLNKNKVFRSANPLTSVVAIGPHAKKICNNKTGSSYGVNSPFDILTKLNAKMLFLGVDLKFMTYVHYAEQLVGVPHRYFKFHGNILYKNKKKIKLPIISYVRYLDYSVVGDLKGNNRKFEKAKLVKKVSFGKSKIRALEFQKVLNFLINKLQKNPFYLLKKKPYFDNKLPPLI